MKSSVSNFRHHRERIVSIRAVNSFLSNQTVTNASPQSASCLHADVVLYSRMSPSISKWFGDAISAPQFLRPEFIEVQLEVFVFGLFISECRPRFVRRHIAHPLDTDTQASRQLF